MSTTPPVVTLTAPSIGQTSPQRRPRFVRAESSVRFDDKAMVVETPRPLLRRGQSVTSPFGQVEPATPMDLNDTNPFERHAARRAKPNLFGYRTNYKPLWLLGFGTAGNVLYGTGALALERGIYPRRPVARPGGDSANLPGLFQPLFGSRPASIGVGATAVGLGTLVATTACVLFYQDARRLARRQNSANPNYTRPNVYFGVHLAAIVLSVGGKFMSEALRDVVERDTTWLAGVPSLIGQAAFAVTQAQAFSGCEVLNRKMPLQHRSAIGFAARTAAGAWTVLGVMNTVPYFNPYARELTRLFCQSAMTLAFSLPLTTARINRTQRVDPAAPHPDPSWYTLQVLAFYLCGRVLLGYAPDLLQQPQAQANDGQATTSLATGGAVMLSVGTAICVSALMLYRDDVAAYDRKKANLLAGTGVTAVLLIMAYRGIFEAALTTQHRSLTWVSTVPGCLGAGLRLAVMSELFAFSELRNGDLPLPMRYHWTEACRALGILGYGLWAAMLSVPDFNPYVREGVGIFAALSATLGMALPTTTSRRAMPQFDWPLSPGATPEAEVEGFTLSPMRLLNAEPA